MGTQVARSEYQIYVNFKRAQDVATNLRTIARDTRTAANDDLGTALTGIGNSWHGENADAFLDKGDLIKNSLLDRARSIERTADAVEKMAKYIYDAEMKAVRIAANE